MSLQMKYFVLRPRSKSPNDRHAQASREAIRAYADEISEVDPRLAYDLRIWVAEESHLEKKMRDAELERYACLNGDNKDP